MGRRGGAPPEKKKPVVWQEDKGNDGSVINQKHCDTNKGRQETQPAHSHSVQTTIMVHNRQSIKPLCHWSQRWKAALQDPPGFLRLSGLSSGEKTVEVPFIWGCTFGQSMFWGKLANFGRAPGALSASLRWSRYFHRRDHTPTKAQYPVPGDSHQPTHTSPSIPKSASFFLT